MGGSQPDPVSQLSLPPGFRFYPTDEELLVHYLCRKVAGQQIGLQIIGEIDLYKFDPWLLPSKAIFGEKEWYFFSPRDRKYPNGSRPNRVAGSGYWKATGTDKIIMTDGRKIGIKKALVFYVGKAPKGTKTNWIMHEYRLSESTKKSGSSRLDDWVLCRIYKKNSSSQKPMSSASAATVEHSNGSSSSSSSHLDYVLEPLPEMDDRLLSQLSRMNSLKNLQQEEKLNFQNLGSGKFDWTSLANLCSMPELVPNSQAQGQRPANNFHFPSIPSERIGSSIEEEVESGVRTQRGENSGFYLQNSSGFAHQFADSLDPFGIRYPNLESGGVFGYRQ